MERKTASGIVFTLLLTAVLTVAVSAQQNDRIFEVIYSVHSPDRVDSSGLEWDGTSLWVSGTFNGMIYRFDPFTNTTLRSFRGPSNNLRDLAWDGVNLWVTSWDWPRNIYKLNPIDGSVITSFSPPFSGHPNGLAWDGDYLWVGEEEGKIYRVDPSTGQTIYSFSVPFEPMFNPRGLAWDEEHIWAGYQSVGLIKEHDITTGNVLTTFTSPSGGFQQGLAWDGQYLWSTGSDNYIYQIRVDIIPPVANAGPDQTVYEDALVTFDGSGSSDNVGIVSYVWTFVDVTPQTLTGVNPTHAFTIPSIYTVTLDVSDAAGNHATDTVTIAVLKLTPEYLTQRLIETIETWNLPKGTKNSLTSKLEDTLHLLDLSNENGAAHKLMDFMNQVEALRGRKIDDVQADYLISEAQRIIDLINE